MTNFLPRERLDIWTRDPAAIGLVQEDPQLRRLPDGDIDYPYYLDRARAERSKAAHDMAHGVGRFFRRLFAPSGKRAVRRTLHYL